MRKLALLLCCLLLASTAKAQQVTPAAWHSVSQGSTGAGCYVGPGDQVGGAFFFVGLFAYNCVYAATLSPAADVCDTSTGLTCTTVNFLATGKIDKVTAAALPQCATSCSVTKLYDSTGNGRHVTSSSISTALLLAFNCVNTNDPCLRTAATTTMNSTSFTVTPSSFSLMAVSKRTASFTTNQNILNAAVAPFIQIRYFNTVNTVVYNDQASGFDSATASDSTFHQIIGATGSSQASLYIDGNAPVNSTSTTVSNTGAWGITSTAIAGIDFLGAGVWSGKMSTVQASAMSTLTHSILGF